MRRVILFSIFMTAFSFTQFHHGLSVRKTGKGNQVLYSVATVAPYQMVGIVRSGLHLENAGSTYRPDPYSYQWVEVATRQVTYFLITTEINRSLFINTMEGSFRPMLNAEFGGITSLGRIDETFSHRYRFRPMLTLGFGAELIFDQKKYNITIRYFSSPDIQGKAMIDLTYFWN